MKNSQTMEMVSGLIRETDPEWARERRKDHLCTQISALVLDTWMLMAKYERFEQCEQTELMLVYGQYVQENVTKLTKLWRAIFALRKPETKDTITDEMIQAAKEYPFQELLPVNRGMAVCPFHGDKNPSFSVKNNRGYCFGCQWKGDTIQFLMERDGLTFPDAIRRLAA